MQVRSLYVIKKYTSETIQTLGDLKETPENHARKSVQMHMLAKNLSDLCNYRLRALGVTDKLLSYENIALEKMQLLDEVVTIELFKEGEFTKYINVVIYKRF